MAKRELEDIKDASIKLSNLMKDATGELEESVRKT